jgi:hypothetical protein
MADGLRSLKYGIGPNEVVPTKPITREDLQNMGLLAVDIISPAHDIKEYQQGVQKTMQGNLWGIPQALAGLLGIAIPGSKYIKQGTSNLIKRVAPKKVRVLKHLDDSPKIPEGQEIKVFHGTRRPYKQDIFKTPDNVLYTTKNPNEASLFARNIEPKDFGTYRTGARVYPLRIKKDAKIFDPSRDDHWKKLMEDNDFKQWLQNMHTQHNQLLIDEPMDIIKDPKKFRKLFRKNKYFGHVGHLIEDESLQPILKRHGFDGFTVREAGETNIGMFLDPEGGSDMLKYLHEKQQGGSIRDYYKNYNTQRLI